jgi:hypothetical protein
LGCNRLQKPPALSGCIGVSQCDTPASPSAHAAFSLGFADKPYSRISSKGNFVFSVLDAANEADLHSYERSFYRAFGSAANLDRIWTIDHKNKRIITKIPYETQEIFAAKIGERIVAAAAINAGLANPLQLELEGFSIDKSAGGVCEIVHMFSLLDLMGGTPMLKLFTRFFLEKLAAKNMKKLYGTCSERRVRPYRMIGLNVIGELTYNNEKIFLLELDFEKTLPKLQGIDSFY